MTTESEAATVELDTSADKLEPVEIVLEGDKPEPIAPAAGKKVDPVVTADEGIADLKRQLEAEKAARTADAARARDAEARERDARRAATEASAGMVTSAIDAAKMESDKAKADYRAALEAGDHAKAADAQERLADARANLLRLQERKTEVERPRQQITDPVEALASNLSPRSADWVRRHADLVRDQAGMDRISRADSLAFGEGLDRDSDAYFSRVEEILGLRAKPEIAREREKPAAQAPVQREATSLRSGQPQRQTITLSAEERSVAREMGMTDLEYAREKAAAIRDGQISARH